MINCFFSFLSLLFVLHAQAFAEFPTNLYPALNLTQDLRVIKNDSNDPFIYSDAFVPREIKISSLSWVTTGVMPSPVKLQRSNNNVSITVFENRLFIAFRTSKTHFAGSDTRLYVLSSLDGLKWDFEMEVYLETDLREPQLTVINNQLQFMYFKGGSNPLEFKPSSMNRFVREKLGQWKDSGTVLHEGEVPWEIKSRKGKTYLTSYKGSHYNLSGKSDVNVMFQETVDGNKFTGGVVYHGGVSEVGWEFDELGNLWAVTRNEDGDDNGFGSQVMFASKENLQAWKQIGTLDPNCYQSPKMFRVGKELYLIGRKNLAEKPFMRTDMSYPMMLQRIFNWVGFSLTPKGSALYKINKSNGRIEFVMDLPGHGDTSFPSIHRLNEKEFLIANYTSDLTDKERSWIVGQLNDTQIYLLKLTFN